MSVSKIPWQPRGAVALRIMGGVGLQFRVECLGVKGLGI